MRPRHEPPCEVDDRKFEQHEPQAASEQEPGNLLNRLSPPGREECAGSSNKTEHRRAVMRDEAREKKRPVRVSHILRSNSQGRKEVPCMVQCHKDQDESP